MSPVDNEFLIENYTAVSGLCSASSTMDEGYTPASTCTLVILAGTGANFTNTHQKTRLQTETTLKMHIN